MSAPGTGSHVHVGCWFAVFSGPVTTGASGGSVAGVGEGTVVGAGLGSPEGFVVGSESESPSEGDEHP